MSNLMASLDALAERWADAFWPVLWQSAALGLAVLILTLLLRRTPAAVRFWLWMLVPLRLLAMPLLTVSVPVLPSEGADLVAIAPAATGIAAPAPARQAAGPTRPDPAAAGGAPMTTSAARSAPVRIGPTVWSALMAAWLAGVAFLAVRLLAGWHALRRTLASAAAASDGAMLQAADEAASGLGLRRVPRIFVVKEVATPFVSGVLRPIVVLPEGAVRQMSPENLRAVLAHEFAHVRRRDPLLGWVLALCGVAYWFHPAFHLARRHLMRERENACDDCVLALGQVAPGLYADALIAAAESCEWTRHRLLPVVTAAESFEQLRHRITRIFADLRRAARLSRTTAALLLVLALVSAPGLVLTARSVAAQGEGAPAEPLPEPTGEMVTFKGIVTDSDEQPIPEAQVRCDLIYGKRRPNWRVAYAEARADAAGRFTLGPVPVFKKEDAGYLLICQHPRHAVGKFGPWRQGKGDPGDIRIKLARPAVVSGLVTDEDGKGVPGATVAAELQISEQGRGAYDFLSLDSDNGLAARTDAEGRFEFRNVPDEARVHLYVKAEGHAVYSTREGHGGDAYPVRAGATGVAVVLQPGGSIEGQLTLGGKPYRDAGIPVLAEGPMRLDPAFTDRDGRFVVKGLLPGTYSAVVRLISLPDPKLACAPAVGIKVERGATVKSVEIALFKGPTVSGVVLSERTGDPAPDAAVWGFKGESVVSRSKTGADGRYHLPLPPGEFEVGVQAWAHSSAKWVKKPVQVSEAGAAGDVDFSVAVREKVHGRLVDKAGRPLRGTVQLGDAVETADDGTFSLPEPFGAPGALEVGLAFDNDKKLGRGFLWQHADLGKELKLVLEPLANLTGRFVDEQGSPIAGVEANLHIRLRDGRSLSFGPQHSPWRIAVEKDGSFTVTGVPVGLRVQVYGEKRGFSCTVREHVDLAAGQTLKLGGVTMRRFAPGKPAPGVDPDAPVEWTAVLAGRILNEEGAPVRGARVSADVGPGMPPEDNTDREGRFRLRGLPTGRLIRLTASFQGYGFTAFPEVQTGQEDLELFIFPPGYEWYNKPAPPLVVQKWFNSDPISFDDLRGKVVLLQVGIHIGNYSTFADQMRGALGKYGDKGLAVIAVHQDLSVTWPSAVTEEQVAAYLAAQKITWPVALDAPSSQVPAGIPRNRVIGNGATYSVYDVKAQPGLYLIDKKGILRCSPTEQNLNGWIERLLAE